jgi:hypothetical protein
MEASDRGIFSSIEVESWKVEPIKTDDGDLMQNIPHGRLTQSSCLLRRIGEWFDIGLYEVGTGKINWLTQGIGDDTSPCWSRDGSRIGWVHAEGAANSLDDP